MNTSGEELDNERMLEDSLSHLSFLNMIWKIFHHVHKAQVIKCPFRRRKKELIKEGIQRYASGILVVIFSAQLALKNDHTGYANRKNDSNYSGHN